MKKWFLILLDIMLLFASFPAYADEGLYQEASNLTGVTTAAVILNGEQEIDWICGIPYEEPGFSAAGEDGRDCTDAVKIEGEVICWMVGDYELSYQLKKKKNVIASATRRVHVVPAELPETVQPHRTIYLTFDDGPCENTEMVLDILNKYNIKATFFVIAGRSHYLELLPKIVEEGHTLGIHCYSHYIEGLYWDADSFFTDFMKAQEVIYHYTGSYAHVSRLPGGSRTANNLAITLPGRYDELRELMHNMGVRYYDWNVQPESYTETDGVIYNFTHPDEDYDFAIVLQHDTRTYSVKALDIMIQWALEQGYQFAPIDLTTPEIHFH